MPSTPEAKGVSFGGCSFCKLSPIREDLGAATKVLNVTMTFEDALKFSLAVDECVRRLNSYNHATTAGRRAALSLVIKLEQGRIMVKEGKL